LDQRALQQIDSGLEQELETWSVGPDGATFMQMETDFFQAECSGGQLEGLPYPT